MNDAAIQSRMVRTAWVFYLLLGLGGIVWIGWRHGRIRADLFVDPDGWWLDLGLGVGLGLALVGLWWAGERLLPSARELGDKIATLLGPLGREEVFALAFLSGVAEELFFRGAVQGSWGWVWATLLFALLHTGPGSPFGLWTVFAAVAGGLFGGLMAWRGNLLGPIVAHFLVNAVNLARITAASPAAAGGAISANDAGGTGERDDR